MRPVTPLLTVDAVIETDGGGIVLVERRFLPRGWAIPGGFVDPGESLFDAVRREAREETGLEVEVHEIFHVYSRPWRDPRGDTVSVIFRCSASGTPEGADDALRAVAFAPGELPLGAMAFDHGRILAQYLEWRRTGVRPPPSE